jgi:hypothetical protein
MLTTAVFDTKPYDREYLAHAPGAERVSAFPESADEPRHPGNLPPNDLHDPAHDPLPRHIQRALCDP